VFFRISSWGRCDANTVAAAFFARGNAGECLPVSMEQAAGQTEFFAYLGSSHFKSF
jgi:hypothetical protein